MMQSTWNSWCYIPVELVETRHTSLISTTIYNSTNGRCTTMETLSFTITGCLFDLKSTVHKIVNTEKDSLEKLLKYMQQFDRYLVRCEYPRTYTPTDETLQFKIYEDNRQLHNIHFNT